MVLFNQNLFPLIHFPTVLYPSLVMSWLERSYDPCVALFIASSHIAFTSFFVSQLQPQGFAKSITSTLSFVVAAKDNKSLQDQYCLQHNYNK